MMMHDMDSAAEDRDDSGGCGQVVPDPQRESATEGAAWTPS